MWVVRFILGPVLGPTVGGYLADELPWRFIFYLSLPVGILGFALASLFLFEPANVRGPARIDWWGLGLMVLGFGCLQLVLDRGEREEWFDSPVIVWLAVLAVAGLVAFLVRELMASEPILELTVFSSDRRQPSITSRGRHASVDARSRAISRSDTAMRTRQRSLRRRGRA